MIAAGNVRERHTHQKKISAGLNFSRSIRSSATAEVIDRQRYIGEKLRLATQTADDG